MKKLTSVIVCLLAGATVLATTPVWALTAEQEAKLLPVDGAYTDTFGFSVAMSGGTALIGAHQNDDNGLGSGSAYIFVRTGDMWVEQAKLLPTDGAPGDFFGGSVSLDGDMAVVAAVNDDDNGIDSGSVYVFVRSDGSWSEQAKLLPLDGALQDKFGVVALDGHTVVVGAYKDDDNGYNSGSAYVFTRDGNSWMEQGKLLPADGASGDGFGSSVAIDGDTVVIGAPGDDDNSTQSGSVYVFTRFGGIWSEQGKLVPMDGVGYDFFGSSVAVDRDTVVVGADGDDDNGLNSGSAYVFVRTAQVWSEQGKLVPTDGADGAFFGGSVAVEGDTAVIGADNDDYKGSVYLFTRTAGVWSEHAKLVSTDGESGDSFGVDVARDLDRIVIGAMGDGDNGILSGSAYVFRLIPPDADGDGINDGVDFCPDTTIPESVPTNNLGVNRWALVDDDGVFDTTPPPGGGGGPDFEFIVADTGGCSCEQIIESWALGWGHTKFGCSTGAMLQWIAYVGDYSLTQIEIEPKQTTEGAVQTLMERGGNPSASSQGTPAESPPRRQQSLIRKRTPRRDNDRE